MRTWSYLSKIPRDIPENVKYVQIQYNDIHNLYAGDFSRLSQCEVMNLDDNSIRNIESGSFSGLDNLKNLSICANWVLNLKAEMWQGMQNLQELTLCTSLFGPETKIHNGAFSSLPKLEILRLGSHGLRSLKDEMFTGLNSLRILKIYENFIDNIIKEGTFKYLGSLEHLILSDNNIFELEDGTFTDLSNLIELDFYDNKLGSPYDDYSPIRPGMWDGLTSLRKLSLRKNWIGTLQSGAFSNLPNMKELDLRENTLLGLKTLDSNIFEPDGHPSQLLLDISENELDCDAALCWLKEGEEEGWLTLQATPSCKNSTWEDVLTQCIE